MKEMKRISAKVGALSVVVMDNYEQGIELSYEDFTDFEPWERKQLERIGTLLRCVNLRKSSGVDVLAAILQKNMSSGIGELL